MIKSYTDIEQSKKLAEILPLESADMWWSRCTITDFGDGILKVSYAVEPCNISWFKNTREDIPCWSIAALLSVLPDDCGIDKENGKYVASYIISDECGAYTKNNPIDAVFEMILKLHEIKII